ncbi:hypothetical protein RPSD_36760 (plasmid) [Ralstonia solanacearum]|nr:hypothetical protein RPSD_36760 [Ralstonia solanacearum]
MTDTRSPALPIPTLTRWQPLRLGLVELFHYDSEEFWFRDGRLLLRGNNGTGKSKVLSLTLPFLFDAYLKPSRIEPDGDASKKMAWNLLLGRHERRIGYAWVEFGRVDEDGRHHYLTLGSGLSAVAARGQVDTWFFMLDERRINQDFWLMSPTRVVLTRDRLREALQDCGQFFDTAAPYRRAVDERLFRLGSTRYAALIDTLIQLRQPQLSKKPDEASLSNALTEALPPISNDLLADVADALNQLEEYRRELEEYEALERAVGQFNQRYQRYAATQARRQARNLRTAQTGFDNASRELNAAREALETTQAEEQHADQAWRQADTVLTTNRTRLEELQNDPAMADAKTLEKADADSRQRRKEANTARQTCYDMQTRLERERQATRTRAQRAEHAGRALAESREDAVQAAERAGLAPAYSANPLACADAHTLQPLALDTARQDLRRASIERREQVALLLRRCDETDHAEQTHARARRPSTTNVPTRRKPLPHSAKRPILPSIGRAIHCSTRGSAISTVCGSYIAPMAPTHWKRWHPGPSACRAITRPAPRCTAPSRPQACVWRDARPHCKTIAMRWNRNATPCATNARVLNRVKTPCRSPRTGARPTYVPSAQAHRCGNWWTSAPARPQPTAPASKPRCKPRACSTLG